VSLVLVGLAWTIPFLQPYHRFPLTSFYSEWLAFALGLAAATLLLRRESWRDAALPAIALAPLGLVVVLCIQVALGRVPYPGQALLASLYLLWAVLLILLGQLLRREVSLAVVATWLAWFLLGGGILHALVGLAQHYGLHGPPLDVLVARKGEPVVYGNLAQANHYAACVSFALASASYLHARRALGGAALAFLIPLFVAALALAGARSAWLYLAAFIGIALALWRLRRDAESRRLAGVAAGLPLAYIAAQWLVTLPVLIPADGAAMQTSADRLFETAHGFQTRLQLWGEAWQLFLTAPLLGSGLGQFAWQHFLEQAASGELTTVRVYNHAHNIAVQLLAEFGAAGAFIIAAPALVWIADLRGVRLTLEWWWVLALLSVIGIHSMLEHPLWYAYFLGVAALLLGLGAERRMTVRRGAARAATAILILLGCVNLVAVMAPYRDFERLVFDAAAAPPPAAGAQQFAEAMMRAHRDPLLRPYVELALALGAPIRTDGLQEQLELNTRVMRFAPVAAVVYRQALLLALAGRREAALAQLERALRVYPADAADFLAELEDAARRHPDEVMPLLELGTAKLAPRSARPGAR
jgi:O-antigen ligase